MSKKARNSAKCLICNQEIESKYGHDYQMCWCMKDWSAIMTLVGKYYQRGSKEYESVSKLRKGIFVDGGLNYIRHGGHINTDDYVDTSIYPDKD